MNTQAPLQDVELFCADIRRTQTDFFDANALISISRAPGRLDVMGGIGDYSGCLVLEMPLANATLCAAQRRRDDHICIRSLDPANASVCMEAVFNIQDIQSGSLSTIEQAHAYFKDHSELNWAAYIVGVLIILKQRCDVAINSGISMYVQSQVPLGKGVSSSAALEVASMQAACAIYEHHLDAVSLAIHCQEVENLIVGAPCGLMDQMASSTGQAHHLMRMHCQPADVQGHIPIPAHLGVWGIDSGIRHAVGGSDYGSVRIGAFMAYRIIADLCGLTINQREGGIDIIDERWHNYLSNVSVDEWKQEFELRVPEAISGADFIQRYHNTHDPITTIEPQVMYYPRRTAWYPIGEQHRVMRFVDLISQDNNEEQGQALGQIMFTSHDAYSAIGLGSDGTDHLVRLVKELGPDRGLFGAKISGGGSGGTVAILGRSDAQEAVEEVMQRYALESGRSPELFSSSSPGAAAFGIQTFSIKKD